MWLSLLIQHWKTVVYGIAVISVWILGFHFGAGHVQGQWDAERSAQVEVTRLKQEQWNIASAGYQKVIADQKSTLETNRSRINALSKTYHACVAGADVAGLWSETFTTSKGAK